MKRFFQATTKPFTAVTSSLPMILLACGMSFVAWYITFTNNLVMLYNDAMSHLNISRLVIDNLQPGLAQLGGVWLPLSHVLPLPLVWNNWAWQSGFAGSFVSMVAYILAVWAIYKTVLILTQKKAAAVIGGLAFGLNLNILYLQSTPLTEPLYVGLFALSALTFTLWVSQEKNVGYLLILGVLGFFQVLARYDGWFVVVMTAGLIALHELFIKRKSISETFGKLLLYGVPVAFGIALWLLWNILIFKDPLFFALGPYSARAQQAAIENSTGLITKGDWYYASLAYWYAMMHNVGLYVLTFASFGAAVFLFIKRGIISFSKKLLVLLFLASPIFFNILALFLGFSILNMPDLNWNPSGNSNNSWFNIRYGILALPIAAVLLGFFASWRKLAVVIAFEIIILQAHVMYTNGIVTIIDGQVGSSAFNAGNISGALGERVKPEDKVIMSIYSFNPVAYKSGIQLKQIVHEGVQDHWGDALKEPQKYAKWVVVANTEGDIVYKELITNKNKNFSKNYTMVYTGNNSSIYERNF